jgi:hypothetical protein
MCHVVPAQFRATLAGLVIAVAACGGAKHATNRSGPSSAGRARDASVDANTNAACPNHAGPPLVCDPSKVAAVAWGPEVLVKQGSGEAPSPTGGTIIPGAYQLVSETLYGSVPPDSDWPHPGQTVNRLLHVDCDVMNELYQDGLNAQAASFGTANDCRRLVPDKLDVIDVAGLIASSGPAIPDLHDEISYTAKNQHLTLFFLNPYVDQARGEILGSYTSVAEFVHVTGNDAGAAGNDAGGGGETAPIAHTERDPRCPANPPSAHDACSPEPAPLECEYGGDVLRHCTTFAMCALDLDGTAHFKLDPPTDCTKANDRACPATFAAAMAMAAEQLDAGAAVGGSGATNRVCNYIDGVCACEAIGLPQEVVPCTWTCRSTASVKDQRTGEICPWPRPLAGDPCVSGSLCDYGLACGGKTSLGPTMVCQNGYWAQADGISFGCRE